MLMPHLIDSTASTSVATAAVKHGARLITHLFNAMPQFHHRDPSIVGLLGSSPSLNPAEHIPLVDVTCEMHTPTPGTPIHDASPASPNRNGTLIGKAFQRPFYGIIVDGIHCHPNSVRVRILPSPHSSSADAHPTLSSRTPLTLRDAS
jgi:N-acetylglucosamine-6-phosphate deacetylase